MTPDTIEAGVRAGRVDEAARLLPPFERFAGSSAAPWALALVARSRALVAPAADVAEVAYAEALELHEQAGRPFEQARTQLLYGELLRRERKRREARDHLRAAAETFASLGAEPWEQRAAAELRATGESARKRDASTLADLTPQELQIARLVAAGNRNREIASQLFLSPRTVEYHLRKVFAKVGITSRAELAQMDLGSDIAAEPVAL
jgi:DNA-binding CsgD family transcriptional regulator